MSSAVQELESFTQFVQQKLSGGDSSLSLEECLQLWRQELERQATLDDIRQGRADLAAGLGEPLEDAFNEVRRRLGLLP